MHGNVTMKLPIKLFYFSILGSELTLSHSTGPSFVMGIFEIGSQELFAGAGFEL
jgi:lipid-A-disaccharide synthase-like uncharacterized protein